MLLCYEVLSMWIFVNIVTFLFSICEISPQTILGSLVGCRLLTTDICHFQYD